MIAKMKQIILILTILSLVSLNCLSQWKCVSGDCSNGYGKKQKGIHKNYAGEESADETYEGMFLNGKEHGHGMYKGWGIKYIGEWLNGTKTGRGIMYTTTSFEYKGIWYPPNSSFYEGDFINGEKTGWGKQQFPNGDYYEGSYINGERNGFGTYYFKNGEIYTGAFVKNNFEGYGILKYTDGYVFMGLFANNKRNGDGALINNKTGEQKSSKWKDDIEIK